MPGPIAPSATLSRKVGIAIALILGGSAIGLQIQAMNGYTKLFSDPRPAPFVIPPRTAEPDAGEVCKTKEDCVDCKKRPEAPEWWNDKK